MRSLALLLSAPVLLAQPAGGGPGQFNLALRLTEPHAYQQRELIRMEVRTPAQTPASGQPPQERWQFAGFLLDPVLDCGTRARPCYLRGGGFNRPDVQFEQGTSITALNSYIPDLPPGRYKVSALARKLVLTARAPFSSTYGYANPEEYNVSNAVEIEIRTATPQWISQTIAGSVAALRQPGEGEASQLAAHQLALLDSPAAWRAALDVLPREESTLLRVLSWTSQPGPVCDLMQSRIPAPEQAVSSYYISTMLQNCERANLAPPPAPPAITGGVTAVISQTPPPAIPVAPVDPQRQAYFENQRAYREDLTNRSTTALAASLAQKQPGSKGVALQALIEHVRQLQYDRPPKAVPLWTDALTQEFVQALPSIEYPRRRNLLTLYTSTFNTPGIASMLESVLDEWKPGDNYEGPRETLYALHKANPARAHARIRAELVREKTWLETTLLDLLPADAVPPMDNELIAAAQQPGGWNTNLRLAAMAKYATPQALPRVRAIYESQQVPCQPELAAYFLRVDPAYAERMFRAAAVPSCTVQYIDRTPALMTHPVLEAYIVPYLMQGDVFVKNTAARSLGRYGSEAALKPLWDTFRYFHEYWKGKGAELAQNGEGVALEVELRNAIARGRQWVAAEKDLRTIEALCISERCLYETQRDLNIWQQPLRIEIHEEGVDIHGSVAQYAWIETMDAFEGKLAQFPRGTEFSLLVTGPNRDEMIARIRNVAARQGFVIRSQ